MVSKRLTGIFKLYEKSDSEEYIRQAFEARYGYPPDIVVFTGGGPEAGPVHTGEELLPGERVVVGTGSDIEKGKA